MKKLFYLLIVVLFISGCIPIIIGAGVVTGYALGSDYASGNVKTGYHTLYNICLDKIKDMETDITSSDESRGIIKAKISDNSVVIKISSINSELQRLRVSARRYVIPKSQFAQKIFFKIVEGLQE